MNQTSKWSFVKSEQGKRHNRKWLGKAIESANLQLLKELSIGSVLNVCCGYDNSGDVLVDVEPSVLRVRQTTLMARALVCADAHALPFVYGSVDTVVCDPPYSLFGKWRWVFELFKIARKRVILSVPQVDVRPPPGWTRELHYVSTNHIYLRLWWVFTKE